MTEIPSPLPENVILFCFDVVKLYPSIPRTEGIAACNEALDARCNPDIPTKAVTNMIETVLYNNAFQFNNKEYLQKEGVAIGSKLGRNFACTYMRKWDEELMKSDKKPLFYKRFIDDGFGLWEHGMEELVRFKEHANRIHPNIKVELRSSLEAIEFLDTWIKVEDGSLITDLYTKPTDKHLYVNSKSSHPTNVKKAIPYGLGLRIRRICSKEEDYQCRRGELKGRLRKRGYSGRFLEAQLKRVDGLDRGKLLEKANRKKMDRVPIVLTYIKQLPNVHSIVRQPMDTLYSSKRMREVFKEVPIVAYRRDRNLGDLLVHGKNQQGVKRT